MNIYNHEQKFNDSKYTKWYYGIIERALQRDTVIITDFYYEKHHILPKSLFSVHKNSKENLVYLTLKEHFICHLLLTKITSGKDRYKMSKAITQLIKILKNTTIELKNLKLQTKQKCGLIRLFKID